MVLLGPALSGCGSSSEPTSAEITARIVPDPVVAVWRQVGFPRPEIGYTGWQPESRFTLELSEGAGVGAHVARIGATLTTGGGTAYFHPNPSEGAVSGGYVPPRGALPIPITTLLASDESPYVIQVRVWLNDDYNNALEVTTTVTVIVPPQT